ncbi:MAG: hypothetical protein WD533_00230 [Dehalococcoidia bacterium]
MWSQTSIPGAPNVLLIDLSRDEAGWEADFCTLLADRLRRRGIGLAASASVRIAAPNDLAGYEDALRRANSIVVITTAAADATAASADLQACWRWLADHVEGPKLFVGCAWQHYDADVNEEILAGGGFAPLAIVPRSPVEARETGLFLFKLFAELHLHTDAGGGITGKMTWFSWSKAKELLKRRGMPGAFGARC